MARWEWVVLILFTVLTVFQWGFGMWIPYIHGSMNRGDDWPLYGLLFFGGCFTWLIPPFWAISRCFWRRPRWTNGLLYFACSFLPLAMSFAIVSLDVPRYVPQYHSGFRAWVVRNVDPVPIQSWLATQVVSDEIVLVQPADWPPAIQRLEPKRVDLWRGQGVALSWGFISRDDSDRRQVFIV